MDPTQEDDAEELAIPFDRRALRFLFLTLSIMGAVILAEIAIFIGDGAFDVLRRGPGWKGLGWRCLETLLLVAFCLGFVFLAQWAAFLGRCLRRGTPAFVFRRDGIVDNASGYWVGLVRWEEVRRVHLADVVLQPFAFPLPRRLRLPLPRQVVVSLKDAGTLRARLPWLKALSFRLEQPPGLIRVGGRLLGVTPEDFVQSLNRYHARHVRREGLP